MGKIAYIWAVLLLLYRVSAVDMASGGFRSVYRKALEIKRAQGRDQGYSPTSSVFLEEPPEMQGAGDCFGAKAEMCKPCPSGEANDCEMIEKECDNLLCHPICLKIVGECSVDKATGKFADAKGEPYATALCAEAMATACIDATCCAKDDPVLTDWVENRVYQDSYPEVAMQHPLCKHDANDKDASKEACTGCMDSGLALKFTGTKAHCEFGMNPTPTRRRLLSYLHGRRQLSRLGLLDQAVAHTRRRAQPDLTALIETRLRATAQATAPIPGGGFPGIGTMKSFQEMCEKVADGIAGYAGIMGKADTKKLCECLGCCDPGPGENYCFFGFWSQQ